MPSSRRPRHGSLLREQQAHVDQGPEVTVRSLALLPALSFYLELELPIERNRCLVVREDASDSLCSSCSRAQSIDAATSADPTPRPRQSRATNIPISPSPKYLPFDRIPADDLVTGVRHDCRVSSNATARGSTSTGGSAAIPSRSSATAANSLANGTRSSSCAGQITNSLSDTRR